MYIANTGTQAVVLIDWEAQCAIYTVAEVVILRQAVVLLGFKVVIENPTAQTHAIFGEVWVSVFKGRIGLVIVTGSVNPHGITGTQEVLLLHPDLEADTAFRAVTDTKVQTTGITLFDLVQHINLIASTRYTHCFGIHSLKVAQTVQTLFTGLDLITGQPRAFHLTHFTAQHFIFSDVIAFKTNTAHVETLTRLDIHHQFDGLVFLIHLWASGHFWIRVAIAPQQGLDVLFHTGHFGAVIQLIRLNMHQRLQCRSMAGQITGQGHTLQFVLLAFIDIDGDVDAFFIRTQADLSRLDTEIGIAVVTVVGLQGFQIAGQFLFLVLTIANQVPPWHFITQGKLGQQGIGAERFVPNDVDLLDVGGYAFGEDQFQIDTVTWQWRHHRFHVGAVFTHAVVEIFQALFDGGQRGTIQRFTHSNPRSIEVLFQGIFFQCLVTGEGNAGNRRTLFDLHQQG